MEAGPLTRTIALLLDNTDHRVHRDRGRRELPDRVDQPGESTTRGCGTSSGLSCGRCSIYGSPSPYSARRWARPSWASEWWIPTVGGLHGRRAWFGGYLPLSFVVLGLGLLGSCSYGYWPGRTNFAGTAVVYDWEAALHASRHRWLRGWNAKARRADLTKADRRSDGRVYPRQVIRHGAEHLTGNESAIGGSRLDAGATLADQPEKPGQSAPPR